MYSVRLNDLKYHAFHGLFTQEKQVGNIFLVNLEVSSSEKLTSRNSLENLMDYVILKDIVDQYMTQTFDLLEDILGNIVNDIQEKYPNTTGQVSIQKCPPPFGGVCKSAEVVMKF